MIAEVRLDAKSGARRPPGSPTPCQAQLPGEALATGQGRAVVQLEHRGEQRAHGLGDRVLGLGAGGLRGRDRLRPTTRRTPSAALPALTKVTPIGE